MKVVLDTNILIDAVHDDFSYTWKIIDLVLKGEIAAVASEKILKENRLIIERNVVKENDQERLEKFLNLVTVVPVYQHLKVVDDDPEDDKFIECAMTVEADYIISSDKHLLHLEHYEHIKILNPKDFWYEYLGQKPDADEEWKDFFKDILGIN